tara:strand:- start:24399 stop:24581 length:183 start_codon:yes stop_codon:yes gene_type:complete
MGVSAIYNGEAVTIVSVEANGNIAYVTYIDSNSDLLLSKFNWPMGGDNETLIVASAAEIL